MLFEIPSPGDPFLVDAGPFHVRWYGLLLALGVLIAGWIARREFRRRNLDPELVYSIAVWAVPLGLVGARLYHVITDWDVFSNDLSQVPAIWNGGLSIFGAVLGGMVGVLIGCRRTKVPFWVVADCVAPGPDPRPGAGPLGQLLQPGAVRPAQHLPWAVKIDNPLAPYAPGTTFHPTFLYESLWDLLVFCILIWFIRRYFNRVPARHGVRALRLPVRPGPDADRDAADRHGRHLPRPAGQRLGGGRDLRDRADRVRDPVPPAHGDAGPAGGASADPGGRRRSRRPRADRAADGRDRGPPQVAAPPPGDARPRPVPSRRSSARRQSASISSPASNSPASARPAPACERVAAGPHEGVGRVQDARLQRPLVRASASRARIHSADSPSSAPAATRACTPASSAVPYTKAASRSRSTRSASRPSSPASRPAYSLGRAGIGADRAAARRAPARVRLRAGRPSGSWALIRPPPAARASSSAARASWTSSSWLPACWGKEATPPDTLIVVPAVACAANVAASRLTSVVADSALIPGSTSANSSPPIRQTQS